MTDTPVSDVRTLIAEEYARFLREEGARDRPWDFADGLAAIVTPVIRRQVAEEIRAHAARHFPKGNLSSDVEHARWRGRMHLDIAARIAAGPMTLEEAAQAFAAAIARSHSTPKEQDHE